MNERLIRLRLSGWMVQLVWNVLQDLPEQLGKSLVLPEDLLPGDDADLRDAWLHSLLEQLDADLSLLRRILARLRSNGVADLEAADADAFLRSVSAVRLSLQGSALAELPDNDLQSDGINIETLPESVQPAYACYLLLADIQGQVIAQIDHNEGIRPADEPNSPHPSDSEESGEEKGGNN